MLFNKRNRLKWYLNFVSLDLNELKEGELTKLMVELRSMTLLRGRERAGILTKTEQKLVTDLKTEYFANESSESKAHSYSIFTECQKHLRDFIYTTLNKSKEEYYFGGFLLESTIEKSGSFVTKKNMLSESLADSAAKYSISLMVKRDSSSQEDVFYVSENNTTKQVVVFINDFLDCLNGIPVDSIKKCPECGHWFYQPTKKEKIYCNNKCASRHIVRKTRKERKKAQSEQYQEEKATGAKRARKSYVKKVRKTNPKAKIGRRPTKHKEE